jgi:hypothetical protein
MAGMQIVCTDKLTSPERTHPHIVSVGTGTDPDRASARSSVEQVRTQIAAGVRFFTVSPSTGAEAEVERFDCPVCTFRTIRSDPDHVTDNNLDNLRPCRWP